MIRVYSETEKRVWEGEQTESDARCLRTHTRPLNGVNFTKVITSFGCECHPEAW